MNRRRIIIFSILVVIQLSVIVGVFLTIRYRYPDSTAEDDLASNQLWPTMTEFFQRVSPTWTLEPGLVFFQSAPCTYPSEYVKTHLSELDTLAIDIWIGEQKYSASDASSIIFSDRNIIFRDLFLQLYVAKVNIRLGADGSTVDLELFRADSFVSEYPSDDDLNIEEIKRAVMLTDTLANFNAGVIGPGVCTGIAQAMQPSPTVFRISLSTVTLTPGRTSSPTPTPMPSTTPTPTATKTAYLVTPRFTSTPTKTEKPEPENPTQAPPTASPQPTRVPPTQPPPTARPTNTEVPPPTPEPTEEPTPTTAPTTAPTEPPTPTLAGP
jgi:hypothetical protein